MGPVLAPISFSPLVQARKIRSKVFGWVSDAPAGGLAGQAVAPCLATADKQAKKNEVFAENSTKIWDERTRMKIGGNSAKATERRRKVRKWCLEHLLPYVKGVSSKNGTKCDRGVIMAGWITRPFEQLAENVKEAQAKLQLSSRAIKLQKRDPRGHFANYSSKSSLRKRKWILGEKLMILFWASDQVEKLKIAQIIFQKCFISLVIGQSWDCAFF